MKITPGDIIILYMCTKNNDHIMHGYWYMVCDSQTERWTVGQLDGRTDGWKKWHIEVGARNVTHY